MGSDRSVKSPSCPRDCCAATFKSHTFKDAGSESVDARPLGKVTVTERLGARPAMARTVVEEKVCF
jgi:hypothetical protein